MKKLSEETGQKIKNISVRGHIHIQLATRNVQRTFMGGYLNYMDVFLCGNLKQIKIY